MNIGILTQPLHNNYGGILQNYALQEVLRRMGHRSVTINIQYQTQKLELPTRIAKYVWRMFKWLRGDRTILFFDVKRQRNFLNTPGKEQKRFIDTHITVEHSRFQLTMDYCNNHQYDAFIVGSDQVWRPRFSPFIPNFFLDFTGTTKVKRISYAASFGTDSWEGTSQQASQFSLLIKRFDAVSVREKSGVKVCKSTFGVDATWVLDPTLLLKAEDYKQLYDSNKCSNNYVAVYVLDNTPKIQNIINSICAGLNLEPKYLGMPTRNGYPSIESWLEGIFESQFVVTDSFHGTVFSILGHKPFVTVVNEGRGASRFESLLESLELKNRIVKDDCRKMLESTIDYQHIDSLLKKYRCDSLLFLKKALDENK